MNIEELITAVRDKSIEFNTSINDYSENKKRILTFLIGNIERLEMKIDLEYEKLALLLAYTPDIFDEIVADTFFQKCLFLLKRSLN